MKLNLYFTYNIITALTTAKLLPLQQQHLNSNSNGVAFTRATTPIVLPSHKQQQCLSLYISNIDFAFKTAMYLPSQQHQQQQQKHQCFPFTSTTTAKLLPSKQQNQSFSFTTATSMLLPTTVYLSSQQQHQ